MFEATKWYLEIQRLRPLLLPWCLGKYEGVVDTGGKGGSLVFRVLDRFKAGGEESEQRGSQRGRGLYSVTLVNPFLSQHRHRSTLSRRCRNTRRDTSLALEAGSPEALTSAQGGPRRIF